MGSALVASPSSVLAMRSGVPRVLAGVTALLSERPKDETFFVELVRIPHPKSSWHIKSECSRYWPDHILARSGWPRICSSPAKVASPCCFQSGVSRATLVLPLIDSLRFFKEAFGLLNYM